MRKGGLNDNLVLDVGVKPGMSGSAVLDEQGNLLGMITLSGSIKYGSGEVTAAVALTASTIARALVKLDPTLAAEIFNDLPEQHIAMNSAASLSYEEDGSTEDATPVIPELVATPGERSDAVAKLHAQSLAATKIMVNLVAKQCLTQDGYKALCHELTIVGGDQTFRKISSDGKLGRVSSSFPHQKQGTWMQSQWSETLEEIADNAWVFEGSVDVNGTGTRNGKGNYLFSYKSVAEDDRCYWEEYAKRNALSGAAHPSWEGSVACVEWVLTDKDFNVIAAFAEMYPPEGCITRVVDTAVYYDLIGLDGMKAPVLLPVTARISAKISGEKRLLNASLTWGDYKAFRAEHKMKY